MDAMSGVGIVASNMGQQNLSLGVQASLIQSIQETQENAVATLMSSVNAVQPSVEPHLGNSIDIRA